MNSRLCPSVYATPREHSRDCGIGFSRPPVARVPHLPWWYYCLCSHIRRAYQTPRSCLYTPRISGAQVETSKMPLCSNFCEISETHSFKPRTRPGSWQSLSSIGVPTSIFAGGHLMNNFLEDLIFRLSSDDVRWPTSKTHGSANVWSDTWVSLSWQRVEAIGLYNISLLMFPKNATVCCLWRSAG